MPRTLLRPLGQPTKRSNQFQQPLQITLVVRCNLLFVGRVCCICGWHGSGDGRCIFLIIFLAKVGEWRLAYYQHGNSKMDKNGEISQHWGTWTFDVRIFFRLENLQTAVVFRFPCFQICFPCQVDLEIPNERHTMYFYVYLYHKYVY